MDDTVTTFLVIVLVIGSLMMLTVLLACYTCIFRDLYCRSESRSKRRHRASIQREFDNANKAAIPLNEFTQGESMPTESEKI
ncbi:PREDICTED: uncharacterized protein LOC105450137 [Wasmannia auropunctata]|uniref:uncharacterized protein LOC105450137 n=1 Tax=Wasmannia auropunctata TaxID=64793 RepID=UPI0005EFBE34|nr:PREDICTED: uncharacterized protein LOC105450137 [Wasmannia auropunctata]